MRAVHVADWTNVVCDDARLKGMGREPKTREVGKGTSK